MCFVLLVGGSSPGWSGARFSPITSTFHAMGADSLNPVADNQI